MASLAVFDPSPLLRAGLAALVSTMGFAPVHEAADLGDLRRREGDGLPPDIMLIGLPPRAAEIAPLIQEIRAWGTGTKVVFIAPTLDPAALAACFGAGASGYLIENISRDGLKHSLLLVGAGENVFPSELAAALSAPDFKASASTDVRRALRDVRATDREIAILRCLAHGHSNRAIAAQLGISKGAVSADIRHILKKLEVSNRTQAALWAVAKGLGPPRVDVEPPGRPGGEQSH